mgnify:CR=1 FL=1
MGKSLVIVESPAKAKTINKYLGKDYVVKSSVGHVRDLPTSGSASTEPKKPVIRGIKLSESEKAAKDRNALFSRMGINPTAGWQANYQILPGKEKVVSELQSLAAKADTIYLATDLDREGEAIAWHLREIIGGDDSRYKRVVFNEITKTAIQEAFAQPSELNIHRVNAQQARRFLDRVVGYMVSPLLWKKLARGLSAGRVQSVAVRLIVDKEREIKAFVPARDFALSRRFFADLGFTECSVGGGVASFSVDGCAFLLQDFYEKALAENLVMHVLVPDVGAWRAHVEAQDLAGRYGARLTPLVEQPWGITEFVLIDPSGVCWHIGQNTPDSPSAGRLPDNPP